MGNTNILLNTKTETFKRQANNTLCISVYTLKKVKTDPEQGAAIVTAPTKQTGVLVVWCKCEWNSTGQSLSCLACNIAAEISASHPTSIKFSSTSLQCDPQHQDW